MEDEFRFHIEMETEANVRSGMAYADARRRAIVAFGGEERQREAMRDGRGGRLIGDLAADLRYGARLLRRAPGFAATAVLTLSLGIGTSSAIFSVAYGVLFRALPYPEPERLVKLYRTDATGEPGLSLSPANFMSLREASRSLTDVAVYDSEDVTLSGHGDARWLEGAEVSAGFFEVMGVAPARGRTFLEGENLPGSADVAVIGHALFRELTETRGDVVGTTLMLHGRPRTVVGVMPAGFDFPYESAVWIPIIHDASWDAADTSRRRNFWLNAVGRLGPGTTLESARTEIALVSARLEEQHPEGNRDVGHTLVPLHDSLVYPARTALLVLLGAVGLVLLIVCANIAGLYLARAAGRQEELAVRVAIGAGRSRIVRQMMTESLLIGMMGGSFGLILAVWATRLLASSRQVDLPRMDAIRVDGAVLVFCLGITLLAVLLTGLVPALTAVRAATAARLRAGGRGAVVRGGSGMRAGLVTAQFALAIVLLSAAGLLLKSFLRLSSSDPGFRTERVLTFQVRLPDSYETDAERQAYFDALLRAIAGLPAVESAGAVFRLPMAWSGFSTRVSDVEGRPAPVPGELESILYRSVTPGYFETMAVPVIRGRAFTDGDREGSHPVAILNETAARRLFAGEDAVGRRLTLTSRGGSALTIVGIVGDVVDRRFTEVQEPEVFMPYAQAPWSYMSVVVRSRGAALAPIDGIRAALNSVDANVPGRDFRTLERVVSDSLARERFLSFLLALFAASALLLAAIGVFGLFTFTVAQRTREIAVRSALGARRSELVTMVLRDALRLLAAGAVLGIAGAVAATRLIEGQLFGVSALDPATFIGVVTLLFCTAVAASLLPARRAARVDPMSALRGE